MSSDRCRRCPFEIRPGRRDTGNNVWVENDHRRRLDVVSVGIRLIYIYIYLSDKKLSAVRSPMMSHGIA